jgi:serine/threonine protein phosphatase PrpC
MPHIGVLFEVRKAETRVGEVATDWHQFRSCGWLVALVLGLALLARLRRRHVGAAGRRRLRPALAAAPSSPEVAPPGESSHEAPTLPSDASGGNARYGFCVNQGPRASMEDAVDSIEQLGCSWPSTEFYAVYDGHGGSSAAEFVKRRLPLIISSRAGYGDTSRIDEALHEAFALTDEELLKTLRPEDKPESTFALSSGSCACVALVRGDRLYVANVGDCRAILCSGGEIEALTVDHRPDDGNEAERDRLAAAGVEVSNDGYLHGRIGVSRAFGDWAYDEEEKCRGLLCLPDIFTAEVTSETEFLLLVCDGIYEKMTTREAGQIVRRRLRTVGDAKDAASELVKHAGKRGGTDNLSALVVLFKRPPPLDDRRAPRLFGPSKTPSAAEAAAPASPEGPASPQDAEVSASPQQEQQQEEEEVLASPQQGQQQQQEEEGAMPSSQIEIAAAA